MAAIVVVAIADRNDGEHEETFPSMHNQVSGRPWTAQQFYVGCSVSATAVHM